MDKESLSRFEEDLMARRNALHLRLSSSTQQRDASFNEAKDEGDQASASEASKVLAAEQAQAIRMLEAVNAGLDRIDAGTFGKCINCGQEIGTKRLEAIPWTQYCIVCQELAA